jgi:FkbM family methyltransferase
MESYSQFGEDRIIFDYFSSISITKGFFLEIGANHPTKLSQTWLLEKNGWIGILIEPLPHLAALLKEQRKNSLVFESAVSSSDKTGHTYLLIKDDPSESELVFDKPADDNSYKIVQVRTLNDILIEAECNRIDFLSIDIEGMEIPALQAFDFQKYRPKMILIEDHCHNLKKHRFLKAKGYKIVNRCGCNNWYIPKQMRYSGEKTVSRYEIIRKIYLGLPFRMIKQWLKAKRWID